MTPGQKTMYNKIPTQPELQSSEEKWKCEECRSITVQYLRAANPFDKTQEITGCPVCFAVNSLVLVCDEPGCTKEVCCGTNTKNGYKMTCSEHVSFMKMRWSGIMMSDITKCTGESCPARDACMRFAIPAKPDKQSWMAPPKWVFTPLCMRDALIQCPYFVADELYVKQETGT